MKSTRSTALRLAAVSDIATPPRRRLTSVTLQDADLILDDMLHVFGEFAVVLRENYAIAVDGVVHLLPANRGER